MRVRNAQLDDIPGLLAMCEAFHNRCAFNAKRFNKAAAESYLKRIIADPNCRAVMHDAGGIAMAVEVAEMGMGTVLRERALMAMPGTGKPLIDAFHAHATDKGVDMTALSMICPDGEIPERLHAHYLSLGYTLAEAVYLRPTD